MTDSSSNGNGSGSRASSGVPGLDLILSGGLVRDRLYLLEGVAGSGKTTIAMQFLIDGARQGERSLYVSLSESRRELEDVAASHGWSLEGVEIHEPVPSGAALDPDHQLTVFHPGEVELGEVMRAVLQRVAAAEPARVVIDSVSDLRLMSGSAFQYRRQVLALKEFFSRRHSTLLVTDDRGPSHDDLDLRTVAHGVMRLEHDTPQYGGERRRLNVLKYRGTMFRGGYHDFVIRRGGVHVFPRLDTSLGRHTTRMRPLPSGIAELDALLGGGIHSGTSTLISGGPGLGKSSIAAQFAVATASRGGAVAFYAFDETCNTLLARCDGLGVPLRAEVEAGTVTVQEVDPAELTPGEFTHTIRDAVRTRGVQMVVIDSLNGYLNAMPEERFLTLHLHELLVTLGQHGVATVLVGVQHAAFGASSISPADASYLADTVLMLRHFEARGEVRQAISVFKKRSGNHERTIREFRLEPGAIRVGEPLRGFRGVLTGVPDYADDGRPLLGAT